jgi:hypothetical protein
MEDDADVNADWLEFLSGTSTAVSASNAITEYTHPHQKPPNRLPTPSSPPSLVSGLSNPGPGPGVRGEHFVGRWTSDEEDGPGPGPAHRVAPMHPGRDGMVHVKEEEAVVV